MNSQIKRGAIISYVSLLINIVIGLCYTPWVIHSIGKEEYGLYSLALSVIALFVFDFGLSSTVSRFLSKYIAEGRLDKAENFMGITMKLYLVADIVILLVLCSFFFFISDVYRGLTLEEIAKFKVIFVISSLFSIFSFPFIPLNGILTAYEKFVQLKLCDLFNKIAIVALMSLCLLSGMGLYALVCVNAVAGILSILFKLLFIKKYVKIKVNWQFWDKSEFKAIFSFSSWIMIMGICQRCVMNICPSILGTLADSSAIAIFSVAIAIEGMFFSFANAINGLFLPKVSRMIASGLETEIEKLMIRVGRIQIFIIGLLFFGFIIVGKPFINVWLGDEYSSVYACVLMLILPSFIHLPEEIASTTIVAKNEVKSQAFVSLLKGASNLLLAVPLVIWYGVEGMAFSVFISYSVYVICMNVSYRKKLNLNIIKFFKETFLKMIPSLLISSLLSYWLSSQLSFSGWLGVTITASITTFCYLIIVGLLGLNQNERHLIRSLFH